jgi:biotin transport system substrate-specific component
MNQDNLRMPVQQMVLAALFTAFIIAGSQLSIPVPLSPVPIGLASMFVLLAGLILGPAWGPVSVCIYLLVGMIGFPVFSKGGSGIVHLFGPTGGYLIAYLPACWIAGQFARISRNSIFFNGIGLALGTIIIYAGGIPWLKVRTGMDWSKSIVAGLLPFIAGDVIKIIVALALAFLLYPIVGNLIKNGKNNNRTEKSES